ncbi:MAG: hypothetical protein ABJK06_05115 [Parasphingorhabdus sp.]
MIFSFAVDDVIIVRRVSRTGDAGHKRTRKMHKALIGGTNFWELG